MSKPLKTLTTAAGIFHLGSLASTTRFEPRTGLVTAIRETGNGPTIELNGRYSDAAEYFALDAEPDPVAEALLRQDAEGVTSGELEVRLPGENDRIIFCNTPEEVMAVLARTVGVRDVAEEVSFLRQALTCGPLDEKRWRGSFGIIGQLAYVSSRRERPAPQFELKETICAFSPTARTRWKVFNSCATFTTGRASDRRENGTTSSAGRIVLIQLPKATLRPLARN